MAAHYWPFVRGVYRWLVDSPHTAKKAYFNVFSYVSFNKLFNRQSRCRCFEWRSCDINVMINMWSEAPHAVRLYQFSSFYQCTINKNMRFAWTHLLKSLSALALRTVRALDKRFGSQMTYSFHICNSLYIIWFHKAWWWYMYAELEPFFSGMHYAIYLMVLSWVSRSKCKWSNEI